MAIRRPPGNPGKKTGQMGSGQKAESATSPLQRYLLRKKAEQSDSSLEPQSSRVSQAPLATRVERAAKGSGAQSSRIGEHSPSTGQAISSEKWSARNSIQLLAFVQRFDLSFLKQFLFRVREWTPKKLFNKMGDLLPPSNQEELARDRSALSLDSVETGSVAEVAFSARQFKPAGFAARAFAYLVDLLVLFALDQFVGSRVLNVLAFVIGEPFALVESGLSLLFYLLLIFIYFGWFYRVKGASPGKLLLGIQVVDAHTGQRLDYGRAFFRESFGKLVSFVPMLAGFVLAALRGDGRGLHDLLFDSVVLDQTADSRLTKPK